MLTSDSRLRGTGLNRRRISAGCGVEAALTKEKGKRMTKETFDLLEGYMQSCMEDSAHDSAHVYRVLYLALEIAKEAEEVDRDVLIGACLLHDIGRKEQFENPQVCHAQAGSEKAYNFLMEQGFSEEYASRVRDCILTHRYRRNNPPRSPEAEILFDADKLDVCGAVGIARTLLYKGQVSEPLYSLNPDGTVSDGAGDAGPSFLQEYRYKLEGIYDRFYTEKGKEMAGKRKEAAASFYRNILAELQEDHSCGRSLLEKYCR